MIHFVCTFSINRAQGVRLTAFEEMQNYGKIVWATSKTFLKMSSGRLHTPQPNSLDPSQAEIYGNHQKSLVYVCHLAPLILFFFTKRPSQKEGGDGSMPLPS